MAPRVPYLGQKASELAMTVAGLGFPATRILKILKDQFLPSSRFARIEYLFTGIRLGLNQLEADNADNQERLRTLEAKLGSDSFSEAVSIACEEAARATNVKKIRQLSAVLVQSLPDNKWADPNEDVPSLIRDVGQLGERDLKVLDILRRVHAAAIENAPTMYFEPDPFTRQTAALNSAIGVNGFHRDDFLSACERLRGFGFAADVVRNISQMAPHDFCYRPTRRGLAVLEYLAKVPSDSQAG